MQRVEFRELESVEVLEGDGRLDLVLELDERNALLPWHRPHLLEARVRLKQASQHLLVERLWQILREQNPMRNYKYTLVV